ncbi:hypothetical protein Y032_0751g2051 [Ancylostoma ceylanicum]|uniref:Uncharacterized protein n=1 Tax=Ancylostoma ceylanicum TaxID=53326 RepID=A0A016WEH6_9BILA|nr:hypothetical protein Y032_0751g2051 [Ancylostoma ceylanicum]
MEIVQRYTTVRLYKRRREETAGRSWHEPSGGPVETTDRGPRLHETLAFATPKRPVITTYSIPLYICACPYYVPGSVLSIFVFRLSAVML